MSLVAYAVRTCLWRALYNRTYAGVRVYDSAVTPLADLLDSDPSPFLIVSTDDDKADVEGHRYTDAGHKLEVVIEIVVASMQNIGSAETPNYALVLPETDEGFEATVNFIGRQVLRVLQADDGIFADLFRSLTPGHKTMTTRRGADDRPRYAARQIVITCDTLSEPPFGEPPADEWARLVAAMQDDEILAPQAPILAAEIEGVALPDWKRLQARLGVTRSGLRAVGLGPHLPGEAPATFAEATIETGIGDVVVTP